MQVQFSCHWWTTLLQRSSLSLIHLGSSSSLMLWTYMCFHTSISSMTWFHQQNEVLHAFASSLLTMQWWSWDLTSSHQQHLEPSKIQCIEVDVAQFLHSLSSHSLCHVYEVVRTQRCSYCCLLPMQFCHSLSTCPQQTSSSTLLFALLRALSSQSSL